MSVNNVTPGLRQRLAGTQDGFCPACGFALPDDLAEAEVDHIIPRARGGPNVPWNKRLVHFACNRRKKAKLTEEALALATEHGITLHEPKPAGWPRGASRVADLQGNWPHSPAAPVYPRKCNWCGAQVVAPTNDPDILVGCPDCDRLYDGSPPLDQVLDNEDLDTLVANSAWACPRCQKWEDDCKCPAA